MRRAMLRLLEAIGDDELADRSEKVARRLARTAAWAGMDTLLAFLSMPREISTAGMIRAAQAAGRPVAVPRIEAEDIRFLVMPPASAVPPGGAQPPGAVVLPGGPLPPRDRWGIPVPDPAWPPLEPARAGRILVAAPGLAFDRQGNRLGRGKGYYDRFLARARAAGARLTVIGVCFSGQLVEELPHTERDQAVDGVVTESETLLFGG